MVGKLRNPILIVSLIVLSISCLSPSSSASSKNFEPGRVCFKSGEIHTFGKNQIICKKFGKRNEWTLIGRKNYKDNKSINQPLKKSSEEMPASPNQYNSKISTSTTANVTNNSHPFLGDIDTQIQGLVDNKTTQLVSYSPSIIQILEGDPNLSGTYPAKVFESALNAVNFFAENRFSIPRSKIVLYMGRTQKWLHDIPSTLGCNFEIPQNKYVGSSFALGDCNSNDNQTHVLIALGPKVLNNGSFDDNLNLTQDFNSITLSRAFYLELISQAPHEIFHIWQGLTYSKGLIASDFPSWLVEGSAQLMSLLANSKFENVKSSNFIEDWFPAFPDITPVQCTASLQNIQGQCVYSEGTLGVAFLVAKFGGLKILKDLFSMPSGISFSNYFENICGEPLENFYEQANSYLKSINWLRS